jgi:ribonuclease VapC
MTMVVDTSALAAIVFGEPDAERFSDALVRHGGDVFIGASTLVETAIVVLARQGDEALNDLWILLDRVGVTIHPFDHGQSVVAINAWKRFGKGRHPAALYFGDCHSYATAKTLGAELLFKGNDFTLTDIPSAL